jgi:hypothetical protein
MLRITTVGASEQERILKLEGRLVDPWVNLLETTCRQHLRVGARVTLDLSGVEFATPSGIAMLRLLEEQGVWCANSSPFLRTLRE